MKVNCAAGSSLSRAALFVLAAINPAAGALALEQKPDEHFGESASKVRGEREQLLALRNTMLEMIERLVADEVIPLEEAQAMIDRAEHDAAEEAARINALREPEPGAVRVQYVPQIVKDELKNDVMASLRQDVVDQVVGEARQEGWGVPAAMPAWLYDIDWNTEIRLRGESILFDDDNQQGFYRNFQAINQAGGIGFAGQDGLLNTAEDRDRIRLRMRLGVNVQVSPRWQAGLRLSTVNRENPLSRNVTFGDAGDDSARAEVDLAYLHYRSDRLTFSGGRIINPFVHTNLVWDPDYVFEGLAASGNIPFSIGPIESRVFLTAGAFALEEVNFSSRDKWLYAGQLGFALDFGGGGGLTLASAYYDFENIVGVRNTPESELTDFTAPVFLQKGNTLFDIRNDTDPNTGLFALASEFELFNTTLFLDTGPIFTTGGGKPVHLFLSGDYVRNVGWDEEDILARTGLFALDERTDGYGVTLGFGSPRINDRGDWYAELLFKHLERDAVLDGITESNFHLGGTDAEGWGLNFLIGLARDTWLELTYLTANEIDGPPLGVGVIQLDLNTRF